MNELAKLAPFGLGGFYERCRITDRNGNPWFVVKDVCAILEIRNYRHAIRDFPDNELSDVVISDTSSNGVTQKRRILIINRKGVLRLIDNSRKPATKEIKERFLEINADIINKGITRASLPQI